MTDLKLLALDEEDLSVISAHVQDAVVRVEDMGQVRTDKRFALIMNRYAWDATGGPAKGQRRRAALHFDRVQGVKATGIDMNAREGVLELLSIGFEPAEKPSGWIDLIFAGGGTIRLEVECIEARLSDLGGVWAAKGRPQHALDGDDA